MLTSNENADILVIYFINLLVNNLLRFRNCSYVEHALAYRINRDIYTPFAGDEGKSLHNQGNLTIEKFVITFIIKPSC